ncbi:uncharacterized protein LOC131690194 [Topomyia yanbarensis]|uniref:uncharacterized protein LOC131690194 n=1 Tax=Topomyia yanbarensis TaxID=2498891 RepID=UPI00273B39C3|nr:uncharacterized protein LOC131690194 [Topomyia yanbarensis]
MEIEIKSEPLTEMSYGELTATLEDHNSSVCEEFSYVDTGSNISNKRRLNETDPKENGVFNSCDELLLLLKQWELEILWDRFSKNLIDVNLLDCMVDMDIVDLCEGLPLRYRIILRQKIRQKRCRNDDLSKSAHKRRRKRAVSIAKNGNIFHGQSNAPASSSLSITGFTNLKAPVNCSTLLNADMDLLSNSPESQKTGKTRAPSQDDRCKQAIDESSTCGLVEDLKPQSQIALASYIDSDTSSETDGVNNESANNSCDSILVHDTNQRKTGETSIIHATNISRIQKSRSNQCDQILKMEKKVKRMESENQMLWERNMSLHNVLSISQPTRAASFKSYLNYPNGDQVLEMHRIAANKDSIFARLLLEVLYPAGFKEMSISGKPSRNPSGAKKNAVEKETLIVVPKNEMPTSDREWIYEMFYDRFIMLGMSESDARAGSNQYRVNSLLRAAFKNERRRKSRTTEQVPTDHLSRSYDGV